MRTASLAALVALAIPAVARADGPMTIGTQAGLGIAASLSTSQALLNRELRAAGWEEIPLARPEYEIHFGGTAYDFTLDLHFQGNGGSGRGPHHEEDALSLDRGTIGVDLGYRAHWNLFTIQPLLGFSSMSTTLCLTGRPDASSALTSSPFQQVLRNPARKTCLESSDVGMDVGVFVAANIVWTLSRSKTDALKGYAAFGPKVAFAMPLTLSREWTPTDEGHVVRLPAFEGPLAPVGGFYVGAEAELRFGLE